MNRHDVTIATITWSRSPAEAEVLARSLEVLTRFGVPVVVVDRGTDRAFVERLCRHRGIDSTVATRDGLVAQVQQSLSRAAQLGTGFVLYTEPDKLAFFENGLQHFVAAAPDDPGIGVVLASRSPDSFATFPPMQRYAEQVVNDLCRGVTGLAADYCYGPFLMERSLIEHVMQLPSNLGWGWRPSVFRAAARSGRRIIALTGDYDCPPEQRHEDEPERLHRLRQLSENVLGLTH